MRLRLESVGSHIYSLLGRRQAIELTEVSQQVPEGCITFVEEFPGLNTQVATLDEIRARLPEAVALVMEANQAMTEED